MFIRLVFISFFLLFFQSNYCQTSVQPYPVLNQPCPEFTLSDVYYSNKKAYNNQDLKGKWLILDFFTSGCLSCFESLPKMSKLSDKFKSKAFVVFCSKDDGVIKSIFDKFKARQNLHLALNLDTSDLMHKWGIASVPHIIILDPEGVVRAITTSINDTLFEQLSEGKEPFISYKKNAFEQTKINYDRSRPYLLDGNGGIDSIFLFRSVLTKATGAMGGNDFINTSNKAEFMGSDISTLYQMAYGDTIYSIPLPQKNSYGKFWKQPLLETRDSQKVRPDPVFFNDVFNYSNFFNYSLIVPSENASAAFLQKCMRSDLENFFGYNVTVENRLMPYWKMTASDKAKVNLKTKPGNKPKKYPPLGGICFRDLPLSLLISELFTFNQKEPPFIDETGIEQNIDIDVDAVLTDFEAVKAALAGQGIMLVKSLKEMKVVVIRDQVSFVAEK